jgi:hypothetical protein
VGERWKKNILSEKMRERERVSECEREREREKKKKNIFHFCLDDLAPTYIFVDTQWFLVLFSTKLLNIEFTITFPPPKKKNLSFSLPPTGTIDTPLMLLSLTFFPTKKFLFYQKNDDDRIYLTSKNESKIRK